MKSLPEPVALVHPWSLSWSGGFAVVRAERAMRLLDLGDGRARPLLEEPAQAWAAVGDEAWLVVAGVLRRFGRDGAERGTPTPLDVDAVEQLSVARAAGWAICGGRRALGVRADGGQVSTRILPPADGLRIAFGAHDWIERRGRALVRGGAGQMRPIGGDELAGGTLAGGSALFGDTALAVQLRDGRDAQLLVLDARRGTLRARVQLRDVATVAYAEAAGVALALTRDGQALAIDFRERSPKVHLVLQERVEAVALDAEARLALCQLPGADGPVVVARPLALGAPVQVAASLRVTPAPEARPQPEALSLSSRPAEPLARARELRGEATLPMSSLTSLPALAAPLPALWQRPRAPLDRAAVAAGLAALRAFAVAVAELALARGRQHRGDATPPPADVAALVAPGAATSDEPVADAVARLQAAEALFSATPLGAIVAELRLSPLATRILLLAVAPRLWSEVATLYGHAAGRAQSGGLDEELLGLLLDVDLLGRAELARELDDGAPLRRSGALEVERSARPHGAIRVHPALLRRISGLDAAQLDSPQFRLREAAPPPLWLPRAQLSRLVRELGTPRSSPPRVVLRGRSGSGRVTVAAALAHSAGRALALVEPLGRYEGELPTLVKEALQTALLSGHLPCVAVRWSTLAAPLRESLALMLDAHPGPLFVRALPDDPVPLRSPALSLELPTPDEAERGAIWTVALTAHALPASLAARLAARYRLTAGAILSAADELARHADDAPDEDALCALVDEAVRSRRGEGLGQVATRVETLATSDDLVVSDDVGQRLCELVARVRNRGTVLERWNLIKANGGARGLVALFEGGPGTGKSLAAGVIAGALGYELWRVDLSQVVSKWVGETEQALARVFDAAEDGDVVLLFDEADALFGKRVVDVKSSNDRHANTQVNYLLQRLDSFDGLAILTTNFGSAIDPAFRRRVAMQLRFEFPEAAEREQLWRVHLPATIPLGEIDLAGLARRYELSGGYIRVAALRASYLAAEEGGPLSQAHLERAIAAEYVDRGKVGAVGRLE